MGDRPGPRMAGSAGPADGDAVRVALDSLASLGDQVIAGGDLGSMTTYRVGGQAALLVTARSEADLTLVAAASDTSRLPVLTVGRGSNLLVAGRGRSGIGRWGSADERRWARLRHRPQPALVPSGGPRCRTR